MRRTPRKRPRPLVPPKPVVRFTTPAQLVASLPVSLGYTPTESLVVVCCHEPRGRTGLTMRVDLPGPRHEGALTEQVERIVRGQEATRVVLVVYTEEPDGAEKARAGLMRRLTDAFDDLVITEALLVRGGRFFSYRCDGACCPAEGRPIDEAADSAAVQTLRLEQLSRGESQLATREELEQTLAGPTRLEEQVALQRCEQLLDLFESTCERAGPTEARRQAVQVWRTAVDEAEDPRREVTPMQAAGLAVSMTDLVVRDSVAALWEQDRPALRRLLEQVARRTPPPYDAAVCTTLAWVTYCDGGGSITAIALERALRSRPDYSMALLLRHAMDNALPPEFVRVITDRTREALKDCA
ncbi:MAG: uncharacterized protein JWM22_2089 [Frankiales bacterium]|nr:uncharacterized protein [Frankiales bacterium]